MIPQEQQLLEDFLNRLATTPATARDPQASALIQQRLASLPDPGYLLVQRAILLEQALKAAQAQISQLQAAQGQNPASASFLGGAGYGGGSVPPPPPGMNQQAAPSWRDRFFGGGNAAPPPPPAPQAAQPSFLGSAARTAAGVAGGMFLAEGLQSMFSGHHDGGGGFFGGGAPDVVENVTNVYEQAPDQGFLGNDGGFVDNGGFDDDSGNWS